MQFVDEENEMKKDICVVTCVFGVGYVGVKRLRLLQLRFDCDSTTTKNEHVHFYARQHICYSAYMPRQFRLSGRLSVRLSVTRVYCIKTAERIIEILSPSDRPIILVFRHQGSLHKSDDFTPNGGAKYKGG